MKSAYELAMERLAQKDGALKPLSGQQKAALAEVDRKAKAKTAEVEIMQRQNLAEAHAGGDAEKIKAAEEQYTAELNKIRANAEAEKERIRNR
ncbi:MAG: hypothetical protein JXR37_23880 [Kiritimatiellae bacterium]|nr:hypothetical protein [Kiritimatiellia bacterium]